MLLRIDKICGGNRPADPQPRSTDAPLHACLATAAVHADDAGRDAPEENALTQGRSQVIPPSPPPDADRPDRSGELFRVGRKNCAVTLEGDKCVSRGHAAIALLSRHAAEHYAEAEGGAAAELLDGRAMMEFGAPTTAAEKAACASSPSGAICVVRDMGSKFGTFVSVDEGLLKAQRGDGNGTGGGGDDETGDETDDEAATTVDYAVLSEKQISAVRLLDGDLDGAVPLPKFQKLAAHQSVPLLQLSHARSGDRPTTAPHVILLFGPQGSAVRLTLRPLLFTFSRVKRAELDPLLGVLRYVGAAHAVQWDVDRSTHLVAPEKTAAAKGIMAYACRRPAVTKEFVEALLARRSPTDPLPREEEYCPPGSWDRKFDYTTEPSTVLRGYRVAVMVDDDNGPLARSAGADVLPIHENAPSDSRVAFEEWWEAEKRRALVEKMALVVVKSSSKKAKSEWLKYDKDVRFTNAKNIAKAITGNNGAGDLLLDAEKKVIEKVEGWGGVAVGGGGEEDATTMVAAKLSTEAATAEAEKQEPDKTAETTRDGKTSAPAGIDDEELNEPERYHEKEMPETTGRKRQQEEEGQVAKKVEEHRIDRQQKRRRQHNTENKEREKHAEEEVPEAEVETSEADVRSPAEDRGTRTSKKTTSTNRSCREADSSSEDEPGPPTARLPLPTAANGWMVAAPRKRRAYRKEIAATEDADMPTSAAETEKNAGLIVRKYIPLAGGAGSRSTGNCKKKDFKRFRKNSVLRGYTSFNPGGRQSRNDQTSLPEIRLVDVMPKESERQRILQQHQQDLEREEELADQLFNDAGGRRRGGGSMLAYLTQSTKKSRGRR